MFMWSEGWSELGAAETVPIIRQRLEGPHQGKETNPHPDVQMSRFLISSCDTSLMWAAILLPRFIKNSFFKNYFFVSECLACMYVCMYVWYVCMYVCMLCMYVCYVCMYVCMLCMYVCVPPVCPGSTLFRRGHQIYLTVDGYDAYKLPCGCWELNLGPLLEQPVL